MCTAFTSDLKRTRQTMKSFLQGLQIIIVLPCSYELSYVKDKSCDGNQGL